MTNPFEIIDKRLINIESLLLDIKHGEIKSDYKPPMTPKDLAELVEELAEQLAPILIEKLENLIITELKEVLKKSI